MLPPPRALLVDFGGVLVDGSPRSRSTSSSAPPELLRRLEVLVGDVVPVAQIARDLADGARRYARWRDTVSNDPRPTELSHEQVWGDVVAVDWPPAAREAVRREATPLSYAWSWRDDWAVRPGIPEALRAAAAAGLPLAVVSNALCGAAHRDFLAAAGLGDMFAVQLYSDEVGLRKPNPELAWRAAAAVGVPVEDCWFVGDTVDRDVRCARRAGAGAAVLMRSPRTDRERPTPEQVASPEAAPERVPDVVIDDGYGLRDLLDRAFGG
ncbi:HAD family hydrolase [Micromonospora sp. HM5-17]|uniref:HAD family hydrolase n=1 Tax=Micromonospora sp. HM5-17 TaxID=2487710 RepID=UPI0018F69345|nr:HAD family hydrolase [Micromonospora sp. HM5-17]